MLGIYASANGGGGGGAAPIDPLTLSPKVWYDPSDASTLFQTDGTTPAVVDGGVGKISDASGNGKHMLQTTGTKQPLYKSSGGLKWLDFDGTDDWMKATVSSSQAQPYTVIAAVLLENASGAVGAVFTDNSSAGTMGAHSSNNYRMYAGSTILSGGTRNTSAHVMFSFFSGASSTMKVDGGQIITGNPGSGAIGGTTLYMGVASSEAAQFLDGRIYAFGIIPRALTAGEEAGVLAFLNAKAGL